jgi:branched-subunit amino acid transport protein
MAKYEHVEAFRLIQYISNKRLSSFVRLFLTFASSEPFTAILAKNLEMNYRRLHGKVLAVVQTVAQTTEHAVLMFYIQNNFVLPFTSTRLPCGCPSRTLSFTDL